MDEKVFIRVLIITAAFVIAVLVLLPLNLGLTASIAIVSIAFAIAGAAVKMRRARLFRILFGVAMYKNEDEKNQKRSMVTDTLINLRLEVDAIASEINSSKPFEPNREGIERGLNITRLIIDLEAANLRLQRAMNIATSCGFKMEAEACVAHCTPYTQFLIDQDDKWGHDDTD